MKMTSPVLILATTLLLQFEVGRAAETNFVCRACCMKSLPPVTFTDKSLYQAESKWTTDGGKGITLGDLKGKPQIVLMFFSHCTTACPVLVNDLRRIESALSPEVRDKVGFTLVSFDSERDTPAALANYRSDWKLPASWTLLHGDSDDVTELAALLGIQFKASSDGQFAHSNVITLLDANGEISFQLAGLDADPKEMVGRIEQMVK